MVHHSGSRNAAEELRVGPGLAPAQRTAARLFHLLGCDDAGLKRVYRVLLNLPLPTTQEAQTQAVAGLNAHVAMLDLIRLYNAPAIREGLDLALHRLVHQLLTVLHRSFPAPPQITMHVIGRNRYTLAPADEQLYRGMVDLLLEAIASGAQQIDLYLTDEPSARQILLVADGTLWERDQTAQQQEVWAAWFATQGLRLERCLHQVTDQTYRTELRLSAAHAVLDFAVRERVVNA